jgi:phosphonate degradation associated HDIG domain protein
MDSLEDLFALFRGQEAQTLYDEVVTALEHALQAAALAAEEGAAPELIAAALLHDVGHLIEHDHEPIGAKLTRDHRHEWSGANYLSRWFGPDVTEPVRLHVAAKRYLCAVDDAYFARLSPASIRTLAVQGGAMSAEEATEFENEHFWAEAMKVRQWDDDAKVADASVPPIETYRATLESLVVSGRSDG